MGRRVKSQPVRTEDPDVVHTYRDLETYLYAFAERAFSLLILVGRPGTAKTRSVRAAIPHAKYISNHTTAFGLYEELFRSQDETIILDDLDSVFANHGLIRLLKSVCQTEAVRQVSWATRAADIAGIPRQFETRSRIVLVTNEWSTVNANVLAVEDRGHVVVFDPTALEVHRQACTWFRDQEIADFLADHAHLIPSLSLRHYRAAEELKKAEALSPGFDWRTRLLSRWLGPKEVAAARLLSDTTYKTMEARARAFEDGGHGCRATFFNIKDRLGGADPLPRITLPSDPPVEESDGIDDLMARLRRRAGQG